MKIHSSIGTEVVFTLNFKKKKKILTSRARASVPHPWGVRTTHSEFLSAF